MRLGKHQKRTLWAYRPTTLRSLGLMSFDRRSRSTRETIARLVRRGLMGVNSYGQAFLTEAGRDLVEQSGSEAWTL